MAAVLLIGAALVRLRAARRVLPLAWMFAAASVTAAERLAAAEPPGVRMLAIVGTLLFAMKAVVGVETRRAAEGAGTGTQLPSGWKWLVFAAGWPGMRPEIFCRLGAARLPDGWALIGRGFGRAVIGAGFVLAARALGPVPAEFSLPGFLATGLLLVGLSLLLHFGFFNVLAGVWRLAGVPCEPQFDAPLRSCSLAEFWGRRWNIAFSDMARRAVYLPLRDRLGREWAATAAFLFSGVLHELAISVPVRAGYGRPFAYFVLHALLMRAERSPSLRPWLTASSRVGRAWTLLCLLLPLPLLFHPAFLDGVVWPLAENLECGAKGSALDRPH